jgi:hypothetical protein
MDPRTRRIEPIGTTTRLLVAAALVYLAVFDGTGGVWSGNDALVGFALLPAAALIFGLIARRYATGPVRFTGAAGTAVNCLVIVALAVNPYTVGGAALFYAMTLLVAALRALPGCEFTVLPNSLLGRDDQVGCPIFSPIDHAEARLRNRRRAPRSETAVESAEHV